MARLLNAHNFLRILQNTLRQLHDHAIDQTNLSDVRIDENLETVDSSSTTVEASSIHEPKKSRKRKRTESQVFEVKDDHVSNYDIERSYFSVCRVIRRLNLFVTDLHDSSQGFVIEYLKASLNGPPVQLAEILGKSLQLANFLSRNIHFSTEDHMNIVEKCISSSVGFWKTCLATADDPSDKPSNVRRKWNVIENVRSFGAPGGIFSPLFNAHTLPSRDDTRIAKFGSNNRGKQQSIRGPYYPKDIIAFSDVFFQFEKPLQF